jgi:hypothetical protein
MTCRKSTTISPFPAKIRWASSPRHGLRQTSPSATHADKPCWERIGARSFYGARPDTDSSDSSRGLSIEGRDRAGNTPLIESAEYGSRDAVEWLLEHGADPNARDNDGGTALHAVYRGLLIAEGDYDEDGAPLVALLEKHRADSTIRDNVGRTPQDYLKQ